MTWSPSATGATAYGCRTPRTSKREDTPGRPRSNGSSSAGKCHDPVECGGCHTSFNATDGQSTHAGDWKAGHQIARWDAGCGCHSGRSSRDYPICFRCHTRDHSLKEIQF